ncbi:hypothetical protein BD289DRAFT_449541 [Coniella lustricola]|uniref:Uncharacterized protein n=1 Tax=Coniella lustricola TaxID=2025994 RepID=A0A2T3AM44_9PEZI|nr:hypothetical protein BD289DRAFT_449541 [Coniella lustricola]
MSFLNSTARIVLRTAATTSTRTTPRAAVARQSTTFQRGYRTTSALQLPYKDDQDRESLKPRSTEGTQSSLGDDEAAHTDTAFDPNKTRPEEEREAAHQEKGHAGNPLETSGASHEKSMPLGQEGGGEMQGTTKSERNKASGHGSQKKSGKGPGSS